jgi:hypothetical protein
MPMMERRILLLDLPLGGVYRITATGSGTAPNTATAGDLSNSNNEDEEKNSVVGSSGSSTIS